MDHPIFYHRNTFPSNDEPDLYRRLYVAVANDKKDEFMTLINDPGIKEVCSHILENIFHYDALEIATAVYTGKTPSLNLMEGIFKDGMTPLHLAVKCSAPRLTKYFLDEGYKVDAMCVDLSIRHISTGEKKTIFDLLWWVCFYNRQRMEIIRMLVRSDQNMWDKEVFLNYALTGELHKLAALFLAVPELFLSSPEGGLCFLINQRLKINSLENKTHIQKQLSLLLDVFASVGHNIAAYIRLGEFTAKSRTTKEIEQSELEIEFFLRKTALGEPPSQENYEYYFSFFEVDHQNSDDADGDVLLLDWDKCTSNLVDNDVFYFLPYLLTRTDFKLHEIYGLIPTLTLEDAGSLTQAIKKKLSSMSALLNCLETIAQASEISKKQAKTSKISKRRAKASKASKKQKKHPPTLTVSHCFVPERPQVYST